MNEKNITIICGMEEKTVKDCLDCKKKDCAVRRFVLKLITPRLTLWVRENEPRDQKETSQKGAYEVAN